MPLDAPGDGHLMIPPLKPQEFTLRPHPFQMSGCMRATLASHLERITQEVSIRSGTPAADPSYGKRA